MERIKMADLNIIDEYSPKRHKTAIHRLFSEVGWMGKDNEEFLDHLISSGKGWVAEIDGQAESFAHTTPAMFRYLNEDLPALVVSAVATSRIARKQGIATRLTAQAVAQDAADGAIVSFIGVFEQGFYNQIGFGTGGYEHIIAFDPAKLKVKKIHRSPKRLGKEDWAIIHQSRLNRMRGHGSLNVIPAEFTRAMCYECKNGFGLGYFDSPDGSLSHHLWIEIANGERGPYIVLWMAYQSYQQFLELLSLLSSFGDQIPLVKMHEPSGIQMQDLFSHPLKDRHISAGSKYETGIRSLAYWQIRICNLSACLSHTNLPSDDFSFNLILDDPIEKYLNPDQSWRGLTGKYIVRLGSPSSLDIGLDPHLLTLESSIGAFSRMWLGVRPASGLSVTDHLSGPSELLHELDKAFIIPEPKPDWVI
jgi:GNAT superfamily N-acetyltransferase